METLSKFVQMRILGAIAGMAAFAISFFLLTLAGWHLQEFLFSWMEKRIWPRLNNLLVRLKNYFNL